MYFAFFSPFNISVLCFPLFPLIFYLPRIPLLSPFTTNPISPKLLTVWFMASLTPLKKKVWKRRLLVLTLPTYCGSDPMYSSSTKNWFHTQPLLTRWNPDAPFLTGPPKLLTCSRPVLLRPSGDEGGRKEKTEPWSTRIQRNSSRQFLVSIGDLWGSGPQVEVR